MKFNATQLDIPFLKERARREADFIMQSESKMRGRSPTQVIVDCLYGHAAECYLIKHCGYTDDSDDYKDVKDKNGKSVEVKVTSHEFNVKYVLERCNEAIKQKWRKHPTKLLIFIGNKTTLDYHLYGSYSYNGIQFIKETK
jgi:hypothetical protein